jgi:hypothetical protein
MPHPVHAEAAPGNARIEPIPFAPGYHVSTDGRVFCARGASMVELAQNAHKDTRYPRVRLTVGGRGRNVRVHRIMAAVFMGEPPSPRHEVRHLNDTKTDNRLDNLAWGTPSENLRDAFRNGRRDPGKSRSGMSEPLVRALRLVASTGMSLRRTARLCGVPESTTHDVVKGRTWGHVGPFTASQLAAAAKARAAVHPRQIPLFREAA